ncbi:2-oxo-4-hydroxy-4-carboxy-5-ureidoimidazoline decarboxylase [Paenibacillus albicereus]|uniref:2-oxo-4-hydroxy-4-carboxy-5-ureidoimidazoline decarboxylase n=1 Tax=Paenibacillus albicereus TaxID=2726185 RepID=A0A6H2H186_9BACL|nr:2-oxo-4-hydroxy-4-carboxy-5-ureidoimidazoline decarboxylase [Paenibacillus albicereus]QJC53430.1 2-oxo-4-hydroxy-4-carboxy-5-ureidoimidazoline decarboxylase [Paenibacillus albicereus]
MSARVTIGELNGMTPERLVEALGGIYEHSPWVAERAAAGRPYASRQELHAAMERTVRESGEQAVLTLLRQHPDLGARLAMSEHSVAEQQGAGLDRLSPEEFETFSALNRQYVERFGFPFILAVKGKDKDGILQALRERTLREREAELEQALREIGRITGFRLADLIDG